MYSQGFHRSRLQSFCVGSTPTSHVLRNHTTHSRLTTVHATAKKRRPQQPRKGTRILLGIQKPTFSTAVGNSGRRSKRKPAKRAAWQEEFTSTASQVARRSDDGQVLSNVLGRSRITCLSASPDGRHLAVGGSKGKVLLLDLTNGDTMHVAHSSAESVQELKWSPDGRKLVIDCFSGTVTVWDREADAFKRVLGIRATWSPDGSRLCTAFEDSMNCIIWSVTSGAAESKLLNRRSERNAYIVRNALCSAVRTTDIKVPVPLWMPSGEIRAFFPDRSVQTIWSEGKAQGVHFHEHGRLDISFKAWNHDGSMYAYIDYRDRSSIWLYIACILPSEESRVFICAVLCSRYCPILTGMDLMVSWRPMGGMLALGTQRKQVLLWNYEKFGVEAENWNRRLGVEAVIGICGNVSALGWSTCGELLFVASRGNLHIFAVEHWLPK